MTIFPDFSEQSQGDAASEHDPRKKYRDIVELILPDSLMIFLAVLMIPIVVIPFLVDLKDSIVLGLHLADYTIVGIFVLEYLFKAAFAKDIRKHMLDPWHILDLIVVILPFFDLLQLLGGFGRWSPVLRLFRLVRVIAAGGRAVDRRMRKREIKKTIAVKPAAMHMRVVDRSLENVIENLTLEQVKEYLDNSSHTWIDISAVSDADIDRLSNVLEIPRLVLESELTEESYPRIDYFESYSMIFARIADFSLAEKGSRRLLVNRTGLLVICYGQNIITISKTENNFFQKILELSRKYHDKDEPILIPVLYAIFKYILEKDKGIIGFLEQELMRLESTPMKARPPDFLETTFHLRKEVNQLVPSLLHKKEIATMISQKRVYLEGFQAKHEKLFDILADETAYLQETAENARDNLLSLIDLYINTSSFELNNVMRIIAVITSLGIIPALAGLLGSNLIDNPWNIKLWQLSGGVGVIMISMIWIFYRLGWLKW